MAIIHPFKAWRPAAGKVKQVSCPPYDVISTEEARAAADDNPISFLRVIRPEIDLPKSISFNDVSVYKKGVENLHKLMENGILQQDEQQALYIYRLIWKGKSQTGIFGCVSVNDYDNDVILKHELTRPDKEDDRTRHIIDQQAHAEPVMLTCKDRAGIGEFAANFCESHEPVYDFTTPDDVTHQLWKVMDTRALEKAFGNLDRLYIADGHHRCKSASRAAEHERAQEGNLTGKEEVNYFPAVIFPMDEMSILPYNRLVNSVPDDFKDKLEKRFDINENANPAPIKKGAVCLYLKGAWLKLTLPIEENPSPVEKLDAHRLQQFILEPLLGIKDPRRDKNIDFVGGIRGTGELEKRVDSGEADLAISMFPTGIEELVEVSDEGLLIPPKSTWFEPKLRSGLLVHTF